ncbi:MAG: HAD family hydrolase [Ruminococcaceae bacterium]|nr:HAD family hydrolase [Oscillospiraceae bacterium]
MYSHLLFDLDGTLTDPGEGITNSVAYALKKRGIAVIDRSELYRFIGPPLTKSFMQYYGLSEEDATQAVADYREYFVPHGMFENKVYDGIADLLSDLKAGGKRLIVATSKPEKFAIQILEHFGLLSYFDRVYGATMDLSRSKKGDIIAYALAAEDISCDRALMIGDRHHDIDGAHENGLAAVGVLYGYGDREEHEAAGAEYIVSSVEELKELLGKV